MRCVITKKPTAILGTWICMVRFTSPASESTYSSREKLAFDIFAVVVVCTNALQQPYRHTSDVTKRLRRDGISLYLVQHFECQDLYWNWTPLITHAGSCKYAQYECNIVLVEANLYRRFLAIRMINIVLTIVLPVRITLYLANYDTDCFPQAEGIFTLLLYVFCMSA